MRKRIYIDGLTESELATLEAAALIMRKQCARHNAVEPYNAPAYDACEHAYWHLMDVLTDGDDTIRNAATDMLLDNTTWGAEYGYITDMTVRHAINRATNDQRIGDR